MAGHSKWANIRFKKEKADAKRGKIFSRVAKEIISAVKLGGSDPKNNPRLKSAIQKAKSVNMPNEIIDRNVKKGGSSDQSAYEELTYEIYGFGGVGMLCEIMTDNRNRIASEVRVVLNKKGGSLAGAGAVAYNFERKGVIQIAKEHALEDELFSVVADVGAEDFDQDEELFFITTDPQRFFPVKEAVQSLGFSCDAASLEMVPKVTVDCTEKDKFANLALIEALEAIDDVDAVYHNMR